MIVPTPGPISSKYGNRIHPVTKLKDRFHNGVDIKAPTGQIVVSPADGKVIDTYDHEYGGLTMIILHDNGYESRMCHLSKYIAAKGDVVKEGQEVAKVGNTGRSTGAHLHYGIRNSKKEYVNPESIINF